MKSTINAQGENNLKNVDCVQRKTHYVQLRTESGCLIVPPSSICQSVHLRAAEGKVD